MKLADSHCHLIYKGLGEQQPEVLARARDAGVVAMLNISTRENEWDQVIAVAEREADVWASVGIHPHEADTHPHVDTAKLVERARHPRVVGIGESGLDYYYDHSDRDRQRASFRAHLAASRETQLPIIVHTRDAEKDTAEILREEMGKGLSRGDPLFHGEPRLWRDRAGARLLYFDFGDRDVQERQGSPGNGGRTAA